MPAPPVNRAPREGFVGALVGDAPAGLLARLVAMMFLQYWPLGLWSVTISTYLAANTGAQGTGAFSAWFVGLSGSAAAIGALASPTVMGWVADRYFSSERVVALLHLLSAAALWWMHASESQTWFFVAMLVFYQFYVPTVSLTNAIAMRHLEGSEQGFYFVRTFGTVAWICAGLFVGLAWPLLSGLKIEDTRVPLLLGLVSELAMAAYALTLPKTPPPRKAGGRAGGAATPSILRNRPLLVFLAVSFLACVPSQVYGSFLNPYLNYAGYENAAAKQTIAQISEVACLLTMPLLLRRFGLKPLFLLGVLTWVVRYSLLALGAAQDWSWPVYTAIAIHGPAFVSIYVAGQLYIDRLADPRSRSAVQGLHALATSGVGHLVGSLAAGWSQAHFLTPEGVTPPPYRWVEFWLAPAVVGLFAAACFALAFREPEPASGDAQMRPHDVPPSPADAIVEPVER
ncbi:MAG: MFS transporter [Lacipirellulaceae bacterium]